MIQQQFASSIKDTRRGCLRVHLADDVVRAHGMLVHATSIIVPRVPSLSSTCLQRGRTMTTPIATVRYAVQTRMTIVAFWRSTTSSTRASPHLAGRGYESRPMYIKPYSSPRICCWSSYRTRLTRRNAKMMMNPNAMAMIPLDGEDALKTP